MKSSFSEDTTFVKSINTALNKDDWKKLQLIQSGLMRSDEYIGPTTVTAVIRKLIRDADVSQS